MNATERILAALQHSEPAPPASNPPPEAMLGLLAASDESRVAPRPEPAAVPGAEEYLVFCELAERRQARARRTRRTVLMLVLALLVIGAASALYLLRPVAVSALNLPAAVVPAAPALTAPDTDAPFVVQVTAAAADPATEPTPATEPVRAFVPPQATTASALKTATPVLPEPGLRLDSTPAPVAGVQVPVAIGQLPPAPIVKPVEQPQRQTRPVGGDVQPVRIMKRVEPQYPESARQARLEGRVRLAATIGTNGAVYNIRRISGPLMLAAAAEKAFREWLYRPAMLDGKPVEAETQVEMNFSLR